MNVLARDERTCDRCAQRTDDWQTIDEAYICAACRAEIAAEDAEVDRLRATTVGREHFDRKIREWIALYDEEQAKRRAAEQQLAGAVEALKSIAFSDHEPVAVDASDLRTRAFVAWKTATGQGGRP